MKDNVTRRSFMKSSVAAGAAFGGFTILGATAKGQGKGYKVGLIGCGGRGNGALGNHLMAAKSLGLDNQVVAVCDFFEEKAIAAGKKHGVPAAQCFGTANGYKKLLDSDVDVVLIATSPNFRPVHVEACVNAGKHVFMEKPVAVDPPGARRVIAAGEKAKEKGLAIVAGTQRRHSRGYNQTAAAIQEGAIGEIRSGCVWWCGGRLWYKTRNDGESDASYLVRNWVSFAEMSGDHIVEQHVHNIDIANWFIGHPPASVVGVGGRARRQTGNQFDFFSLDLEYDRDCHIHSMCRQVNGCWRRVSEYLVGTKGNTGNAVKLAADKGIKIPDFEQHKGGPYVQEHVDLLKSIADGKPINEAENVANATMVAIMGRMSAYTGQKVTWDEVTKPQTKPEIYNFTLKPTAEDFETGKVVAPKDDVIAIPGTA